MLGVFVVDGEVRLRKVMCEGWVRLIVVEYVRSDCHVTKRSMRFLYWWFGKMVNGREYCGVYQFLLKFSTMYY